MQYFMQLPARRFPHYHMQPAFTCGPNLNAMVRRVQLRLRLSQLDAGGPNSPNGMTAGYFTPPEPQTGEDRPICMTLRLSLSRRDAVMTAADILVDGQGAGERGVEG